MLKSMLQQSKQKQSQRLKHYLLCFFLLCSSTYGTAVHAESANPFVGVWQEVTMYYDEIDDENIVSVDDTIFFKVSEHNKKLIISDVSDGIFAVANVQTQKNQLKFIAVNTSDLEDLYVLRYECVLVKNNREMNCEFENQKGEIQQDIRWIKQ